MLSVQTNTQGTREAEFQNNKKNLPPILTSLALNGYFK